MGRGAGPQAPDLPRASLIHPALQAQPSSPQPHSLHRASAPFFQLTGHQPPLQGGGGSSPGVRVWK